MFVLLQLLSVLYRIVSKITISSPFVSIRIVSCDDRIVSSLILTINLRKKESLKEAQHAWGKLAASVLLKLFINGNYEICHTTEASLRINGTLFVNVNNTQYMTLEDKNNMTQRTIVVRGDNLHTLQYGVPDSSSTRALPW